MKNSAPPSVPAGALTIIRTLQERGHQALLAGGCVRDWLMDRAPKDWDVATDAAPEQVMGLFARTVPVGLKFGIVLVVMDDGQYEVARFRRDGAYRDGRRPEAVEFTDVEQDARRRDFTINGMYYDPLSDRVIDLVGGRADIQRRVVRTIGAADERFGEDYLRLLRAARFAARFDFALDDETRVAMQRGAPHLGAISAERIRDELTRILVEGGAARGLQILLDTGLLTQVLPEVAAMEGVPQPAEFHPEGDVWTHVKMVLDGLDNPSETLAWSALLHDIGKPPTMTVAKRIRFDGHDRVGAEMARVICQRLRLSNWATERVFQLTVQHMRIRHVRDMRASKLKRLLRADYFAELLELHRIDCLASHGKLDLYEFCRQQLAAEGEEELRPVRLLSGDDLIAMGYVAGPVFKEILAAVEDGQLEGRLVDRDGAMAFVRANYGDREGGWPSVTKPPASL
ncbi:MAG: HD domain-containing protein [Candidatus Latescibacteria bacterium]|nr:HD domain-containing protein [Candidatus Latescibacterota bacterium]